MYEHYAVSRNDKKSSGRCVSRKFIDNDSGVKKLRKQLTQIFTFQSSSNEYRDSVINDLRDLGGNNMEFKCEGMKCTVIISSKFYAYEKLRKYINLLRDVEILR